MADPCVMVQSPQPDSQVETHLVDLLDFDKFALIKMLVQDRLKVVWCMRLNRAQSDEEHTRIQVHSLYTIVSIVSCICASFCTVLKLKALLYGWQ